MGIKYTPKPSPFHVAKNGKWVDERVDVDILRDLRNERNRALTDSDWTQLPDVPDRIKVPYKEWRQRLRDVTITNSGVKGIELNLRYLIDNKPIIT